MNDLPPGWGWATIDELLAPMRDGRTIHQGWSPKCYKHPSAGDEVWGVLKTTAIQAGSFHPEHNKELPPSLEPRFAIEVSTGDLVLTCAGPRARCGVACLVRSTRPRLMTSGKMYRFRVNEEHISSRYVEAYLQTSRAWLDIDAMKTGGSDSGLNLTQARFRKLHVPVAPRQEQERIVAVIEEHVSRLDAAEAGVRSAQRRVQTLDRTVLARAQAEGDEVNLGDLLLGIEAGKSFKTPGRRAEPGEWGVIKVSAMTWGEFDEDENKVVPADQPIDPRYEIQPGDLLLSRANTSEYVGATVLVSSCRQRLLLSDKSMRLLTNDDGVDRRWLRFALGSPQVRFQMSLLATGTSDSMRNISQAKVRGLRVHLPRPDRQKAIADEIEGALQSRRRLEDDLLVARRRAQRLRTSILAAAFSGQLVPQDPADEPASALLERIRAERAAASPKPRRRKVTAR